MVRLKDIAERAGVSVMTVSKALRNQPDVAEATRQRIHALAREMGYVPDSIARGLRTRTTRLFGVVVPAVTHPIYARVLLALEERAYEMGYDLLCAHTLNLVEREERAIRRMLSRRVEGLFLSPVHRMAGETRIYDELAVSGTPVVILGQPPLSSLPFPSVAGEDIEGAYEGTRHLLELGHRRIAFLAGPVTAPWAQERLEGYRRALQEAGLSFEDRWVFAGGSTIEDGIRVAAQLLEEAPEVTAVLASNDLTAIGCGHYLLNSGVRIPEDLSLVGFGNTLAATYFRVPLTTLRQPKRRLGNAAMDLMTRMLQKEAVESMRLPVTLAVRASSGPPRGTGPLVSRKQAA
ncbi:MAG: LacI family transcriptional regulator [Limisphaera sp.]|nr:LacI family transcriptional regulator [Limisphaera sp.]